LEASHSLCCFCCRMVDNLLAAQVVASMVASGATIVRLECDMVTCTQ